MPLRFSIAQAQEDTMIAFTQLIPKPSAPEFTAKVIGTTIEVTIKNQQLTSYENGSYPSLYYMFRFKDPNTMIGFWDYDPQYFVLPSTYGGYYQASNSEFTIVSLSIEDHHFPSGQIELQAISKVGNQYPTKLENGAVYGFEGVTSGWSNIQIIIIGEGQTPTPSPLTTPTPTSLPKPEFSTTIVLASIVIVAVVGLGIFSYNIKNKRKT